MTLEENDYEVEMIICPHCKKHIQFMMECPDGTIPTIKEIQQTTKTEFNLEDDGK